MIASQYSLSLPVEPAYGATDFMVSPHCNAAAFDAIWRWPQWEQPVLMICGQAGAGKTHLAHIWATRSHATFLAPAEVRREAVEKIMMQGAAARAWVVDNVQQVKDESALFHLLNTVRELDGYLLLMADAPPAALPFTLPDLRSRLAALPLQHLHAPDDTLLSAVLIKQFADRQVRVSEDVVRYLLPRMERSFVAVSQWVARLDAAALATKRNVTVALARQVMGTAE